MIPNNSVQWLRKDYSKILNLPFQCQTMDTLNLKPTGFYSKRKLSSSTLSISSPLITMEENQDLPWSPKYGFPNKKKVYSSLLCLQLWLYVNLKPTTSLQPILKSMSSPCLSNKLLIHTVFLAILKLTQPSSPLPSSLSFLESCSVILVMEESFLPLVSGSVSIKGLLSYYLEFTLSDTWCWWWE